MNFGFLTFKQTLMSYFVKENDYKIDYGRKKTCREFLFSVIAHF